MSFLGDSSLEPDESFGPGTDLVVSLLAVLLLVLVLALRPRQVPADNKPDPPPQILKILEDYEEKPLFEKNNAILTARAKEQLRGELPKILDALKSDGCNQLLVEGHASPEAPPSFSVRIRERWNLKLSVDRSIAVIDYLYELDIPYECMSVAGFRRSHSSILSDWFDSDRSRSLVEWDLGAQNRVGEIGESILAKERVVKIFGIYHESSLCDVVRRRRQGVLPVPMADELTGPLSH